MEYSGMKEIVWGVWKERENMNADMKWLDNPEVFKVCLLYTSDAADEL